MFSRVPVFYHDINDLEGVNDEACRSIRLGDSRVRAKTKLRENSGHKRVIIRDFIEHRTVGAIIHSFDENLELDGFGSSWLWFLHERYERDVVDVVIFIDNAKIGHRSRRVVCDGGRDI